MKAVYFLVALLVVTSVGVVGGVVGAELAEDTTTTTATQTSSTTNPPATFHVEFHSEVVPDDLKAHRPIPETLVRNSKQDDSLSSFTSPSSSPGQGKWKRTKAPNGTEYLCYVPGPADVAEAEFARLSQSGASLRHRRKIGVVPPEISALVAQEMAGACTSKIDVWWTYETCWNAQVRQFHVGNNGAVEKEYFLGKGPIQQVEDGTKEEDLHYGEHPTYGPYLSTVFYNGTECDLTGEPRQTEVRLYCSGAGGSRQPSSNVNLRVTEPKSCQYLVQWWSAQACIPLLQREKGVNVPIKCYDVAFNQDGVEEP